MPSTSLHLSPKFQVMYYLPSTPAVPCCVKGGRRVPARIINARRAGWLWLGILLALLKSHLFRSVRLVCRTGEAA